MRESAQQKAPEPRSKRKKKRLGKWVDIGETRAPALAGAFYWVMRLMNTGKTVGLYQGMGILCGVGTDKKRWAKCRGLNFPTIPPF
jgi:hypothetical protein